MTKSAITPTTRFRKVAVGLALALGVGVAGAQGASASGTATAANAPAATAQRCARAADLATELDERSAKLTARRAEVAQQLADAQTGGDADTEARLQRRLDRLDRVIERLARLEQRVDTYVTNHCPTGQ